MSYGDPVEVAGFCGNILSQSNTAFSESTTPTLVQVESWLSSGCSIIETYLSSWGYSIPPAQNSAIWMMLADLNNVFATARVHLSRTVSTVGPGERTSGQVFNDMFWKSLMELRGKDLTEVGLSRRSADKIYVGGTSVAEKDVWESDSDRVQGRFRRGMFRFPGSVYPDSSEEISAS